MDIHDTEVRSEVFGTGVITEQTGATVTVAFDGISRKFLYPSCFEQFLTAVNPAIQEGILSEIQTAKAQEARRERMERHREMYLVEQQKAEDRKNKPTRKKKQK